MTWGRTSKLFHWLGAAIIFHLLIHGFWMTGLPREVRFGRPLDSVFGWFRVPAIVSDRQLHGPLEDAHVWLSWALALLVVAHIAAAFYHRLWRKDDVMQRMLWPSTSKLGSA